MTNKKKILSIFLSLIIVFQVFSISFISYAEEINEKTRGIYTLSKYYEYDLGRAGKLKVNQYNQEIILIREDLFLPGEKMPVNIKQYYNAYNTGFDNNYFGKGWKTNFNVNLKLANNNNQVLFCQDDGSVVIFEKSNIIKDGLQLWEEVSELGLSSKLWFPEKSVDFSKAEIITAFNEIYNFDSDGRLISVSTLEDKECKQTISYIGSSNKVNYIIDGAERKYIFNYNVFNRLASISCYNKNNKIINITTQSNEQIPINISYEYDVNGNLTKITYPDGNNVQYKYSFNGNLIQIKNIDNRVWNLNYSGKHLSRFSQISSEDKNNSSSERILFSAQNNTKDGLIITEEDGDKVIISEFSKYGLPMPTSKEIKSFLSMVDIDMDEYEFEKSIINILSSTNGDNQIKSLNNDETDHSVAEQQDKQITNEHYSNNGNYIESFTYNGNIKKRYDYDLDNGLLLSEKNGYNTTTKFAYDSSKNLTMMSMELSNLVNGNKIKNVYNYDKDQLKKITHNGFSYEMLYDKWGNYAGNSINSEPFVKYEYKDGNINLLQTETYGNNQSISYIYNNDNKLAAISYDEGNTNAYTYSYFVTDDILVSIDDNINNIKMNIYMDRTEIVDSKSHEVLFSYESTNKGLHMYMKGLEYDYDWSYNTNSLNNSETIDYKYSNDISAELSINKDFNERITSSSLKTTNGDISNKIEYRSDNDLIDCLIKNYTTTYYNNDIKNETRWSYTYDDNGNINNIWKDGNLVSTYEYDNANQLIYANYPNENATVSYNYDVGGNLRERKWTSYLGKQNVEKSKVFSYEYNDSIWKDKLSSFNGINLSYDDIGNPLSYGDNEYTWKNGRQLKSIKNPEYQIRFEYDDLGQRTSKAVYSSDGSIKLYEYNYFWYGLYLAGFSFTDYTDLTKKTDVVTIIMDEDGIPYGYVVNGTEYYLYEKNASNDIVGIFYNGEKIADYSYDAFGNMIYSDEKDCNISFLNPFYYRSYTMDRETDYYYLYSRYYIPEWGRFLNSDIYVDTGTSILGTNMFAYCDNNPVNSIDPFGYWTKADHYNLTKDYVDSYCTNSIIKKRSANVAAGCRAIDEDYPSSRLTVEYQQYHFDRSKYANYSSDSRLVCYSLFLASAELAYRQKNYDGSATLLGNALHPYQDIYAHGYISYNNSVSASHGVNQDKQDYVWKDTSDRGRSVLAGDAVKKGTGSKPRITETKNKSVSVIKIVNGW